MQTDTAMQLDRQSPKHSTGYYVRQVTTQVLTYVLAIIGLLIFFVPVYFMISTSFKAESEVFALPIHWIPHEFTLQNYPQAFAMAPFGQYFFNSVVVAT